MARGNNAGGGEGWTGEMLPKNAKEPDAFAEFFLFFKEALRAHQALPPVLKEIILLFP